MTIIDLLNKIANGEKVPRKFEYEGKTFIYNDLVEEHFDEKEGNSLSCYFDLTDNIVLNDELEIIEDTPKEDKKIEKIDISNFPKKNNSLKKTALKLNEIIDKINGE